MCFCCCGVLFMVLIETDFCLCSASGRGPGGRVPGASVQERGYKWDHSADEVVCHL